MSIAALTHHGGRVDQAAHAYPHAPQPWIDLSTGINPDPWTPAAPLAVDLGRLPTSSELRRLEATAAGYFGAAVANVVAVPGSEIALRLIGRLGLPGLHRYVAPGYRTHAEIFEDGIGVDARSLTRGAGTLVFANPSNPAGQALSADHVRSLAGTGWLIVDEAFADCVPDVSIAADPPERTIVLRSFGKFFGLAGLRLGFVIGPPQIVAALRRLIGDWPVSAPAIVYGTAAYADADWIAATRERLAVQAAALDALLLRHGLIATGDCPLFRLVESDRPLFEQLALAGILTRPFDYDPRWTRIGLPRGDAERHRLDRALARG